MQIFAKEGIEVKEKTVKVFKEMIAAGIPLKNVNEYLETDFEINEQVIQGTEGQTTQGAEGQEGGAAIEPISEEKRRLRVS